MMPVASLVLTQGTAINVPFELISIDEWMNSWMNGGVNE